MLFHMNKMFSLSRNNVLTSSNFWIRFLIFYFVIDFVSNPLIIFVLSSVPSSKFSIIAFFILKNPVSLLIFTFFTTSFIKRDFFSKSLLINFIGFILIFWISKIWLVFYIDMYSDAYFFIGCDEIGKKYISYVPFIISFLWSLFCTLSLRLAILQPFYIDINKEHPDLLIKGFNGIKKYWWKTYSLIFLGGIFYFSYFNKLLLEYQKHSKLDLENDHSLPLVGTVLIVLGSMITLRFFTKELLNGSNQNIKEN